MVQIIRLLRRGSSFGQFVFVLVLAGLQVPGLALEAPCPPGNASVWGPAAKDFLGTSASATSRVYFTGAEGILT